MHSLGISEAKNNFSALIDLVEKGEEVRITRHGKEVVRMLPMRRKPVITDLQIERELGQIDALHATIGPGPSVRALRDEGRQS
ncbi:MAG TPA: type II toxin-antitoxin system prevent-host-death family antitoxin [Variovorax sp.]